MRASCILGLLLVLTIAPCTSAYQIILSPTDDAQLDRVDYAHLDVLTNPPSDGLFMEHHLSTTGELHEGFLEYSLTSLPSDVTVTSASFTYSVNLLTYDDGDPSLNLNLYDGGDGVVTLSDLYKSFVNVAQFKDFTGPGTYATDFSSVVVLNDRDTYFPSGFVGLQLYPGVEGPQTRISSAEDAQQFSTQAPVLTINYTPEPTSLSLLGAGGVLLVMGLRTRRKRRRGAAHGDS